jgi:hypothetical protein
LARYSYGLKPQEEEKHLPKGVIYELKKFYYRASQLSGGLWPLF